MPADVVPPPPPAEIKTNEELYLTGLRMEQFHAPGNADPNAYWQEALRRDPGDIRVNTVLGIDAIKGGRYADAEALLRKALVRATANYTSPKDGEPFYYLGLALKAQGKLDDAYAQLYKSTWSAAWRAPGYFALAEIDSIRGDFNAALQDDDHALEANSLNLRALALKAALLRHAGHKAEALTAVAAVQKLDPLDVQGMTEQWLATQSPASAAALMTAANEHPETVLEVAADYMNAGLWQDGTTLLTHIASVAPDKSKVSPLVYYYLAYFAGQMHQPAKAGEYDRLAEGRAHRLRIPVPDGDDRGAGRGDAERPHRCARALLSGQSAVRLAAAAGAGAVGEVRFAGRGLPSGLSQSGHGLHAAGQPA